MEQRTSVRRHESDLGSWELAERAPHPALAGAVHRYVGYVEKSVTPVRRREPPQDRVTVILGLGPPMTLEGPRLGARRAATFVAPIDDSYAITEFEQLSSGIQVDLSPLAARALLGVPLGELAGAVVVDLEDVVGREAGLLVERLHGAPDWDARFALLDGVIGRRLADARQPPPDVGWAWRRLGETGGSLPVAALAAELGCSRRHLVSRFRDHVGPPPKAVARILRFRRAVAALERRGGSRLAEIAQRCGYYDHAHLDRDFRDLAGTSPSAYAAARMPDGLGVAA